MPEFASLDFDTDGDLAVTVTADRGTGELLSRRFDGDRTEIGSAVSIVASGVERASICVLPDGRWTILYNVGTALYARQSEDGGLSWGAEETIPVTLYTTTPDNGEARFVHRYLPRHRLHALVYQQLASGNICQFLGALQRDTAGTWTAGTFRNLAGVKTGSTWTTSIFANGSVMSGSMAPLGDGSLFYAPYRTAEQYFVDGFGWDTGYGRVRDLMSYAGFREPRYSVNVRCAEHQSGVILCVGVAGTSSSGVAPHLSSGGWRSAVLWRRGASEWGALRDSGFGGGSSDNTIAFCPITEYATYPEAVNGYKGACGQLRRLRDGSLELCYHDRDTGDIAFKRNRMTAWSYYPDPTQPGFTTYEATYWQFSRRDIWEMA